MTNKNHSHLNALLLYLTMPLSCQGEALPLWEVHLGLSTLHVPFYRGSNDSQTVALPFPYLVYRGDKLKISDEGVRNLLVDKRHVEIDVSLGASLPVPDSRDGLRAGMPRLDPSIEIGPSLTIKLWQSVNRQLWLGLPLRFVFAVDDLDFHREGLTFSPYIQLRFERGPWRSNFTVGPLFADTRYHDYFYAVDSAYVTKQRPAYQAQSGYSGSRATLTFKRRLRRSWFGAFLRYDRLEHAVFFDSPLVDSKHYVALGVAWSWRVAASKTLVQRSSATPAAE